MSVIYQANATGAAIKCPHRMQNKAGTECATCGAVRDGPTTTWRFLSPDWQAYYSDGGSRPDGAQA